MAQTNSLARYNDGMAAIYREIGKRSNFSAKINATALSDLTFLGKLAYALQSRRQQDMEFAQQQGFSLEMKIKTRYVSGIDNKCKAVIDGYLYDISYVDSTRTELYLYLQGVGRVAT